MSCKKKVFEKLFAAAEIAKFSPTEKNQYEESLKAYRDMKNVLDTAFSDGKMEEKQYNIRKAIKLGWMSDVELAEFFEVTLDFVLKIKQENDGMN